ncbi:MAG TPA: MFS transporter [Armatimonadota bacterium]|jgi:MFS family permease
MSVKPTERAGGLLRVWRHILAAFEIVRHYPIIIPLALITLIDEINYSGLNNVALPAYIGTLGLPLKVSGGVLASYLGTDGGLVAIIASTFLFSETLFRLPTGWLSDRLGRINLIIGAMFLSAPSFFLSWWVPNYLWLIPLRLWDGMMAAALWTSVYAVIGDAVPERFRANAMGFINMMYMLGLLSGYAIAGGIDKMTGQPRMFLLVSAGLVAVAAVAAWLFFRRRPEYNTPHPDVHLEEAEKAAISVSRHSVLLLITFSQNFALTMIAPFMYRYARDSVAKGGLGLTSAQLLLLVGVPVLGVAIFAVPLSRVADRVGKLTAVRVGFTAVAATLWIFSFTRELWVLSLVATVVGVAFSMGVPAWLAILSSLTSSKTRGATLGGYGAVQGIAAVLGPLVSGPFIWGHYGHASIFLASALVLAFAALLAWFALPEPQKTLAA